jgi:hypothetical protein
VILCKQSSSTYICTLNFTLTAYTRYAGKELTVPEFDNSTSWLYLVGISGFTGTYGIEQINFHVAGQLSNKTGPIAR